MSESETVTPERVAHWYKAATLALAEGLGPETTGMLDLVGNLAPEEAIFQACLLRFRPIMMTTLAALFGALPLVISGGDGSELRQPLGITIVGGLAMSQLLTLYTTPVVYLFFDSLRLRFSRQPRQSVTE